MPPLFRRALPWLLVLVALLPALIILDGTEDHACSSLDAEIPPSSEIVELEPSNPLPLFVTHCEIETEAGARYERTTVNWVGMLLVVALLAGAWIVGAGLGGSLAAGTAVKGTAACAGVFLAGLVIFFV